MCSLLPTSLVGREVRHSSPGPAWGTWVCRGPPPLPRRVDVIDISQQDPRSVRFRPDSSPTPQVLGHPAPEDVSGGPVSTTPLQTTAPEAARRTPKPRMGGRSSLTSSNSSACDPEPRSSPGRTTTQPNSLLLRPSDPPTSEFTPAPAVPRDTSPSVVHVSST